jgi:hypothetical protein
MLNLPGTIINLLNPFAPLFYGETTWEKAKTLLVGAILAPGKRTVSAVLRVMGLGEETRFAAYHHVLSRAVWSAREASYRLLKLLLTYLDQGEAPLVFGVDETIERRWGAKITARGIYRDPVRSSKSHFVKASGLRWVSLMWLAAIPWAERVWALPFLTVLAPSERYYEASPRQPKTLTGWARQMIYQLRRWLPDREIVVVGDGSYAVLELLHACQGLSHPVTMITRLRLDAALYEPAPPPTGKKGRPRKKGQRLPTLQQVLDSPQTAWQTVSLSWYDGQMRVMEFTSNTAIWYHSGKPLVPLRWVLFRDPLGECEPMALLCTTLSYSPLQIAEWFVQRWQLETTFEEARAHLGLETQRQWSDKAIARTTPALLGLFSWVTLLAHVLQADHPLSVRQAAWYSKARPTFSDAMAFVRSYLWPRAYIFRLSCPEPDMVKMPHSLVIRLVDTLCYAA